MKKLLFTVLSILTLAGCKEKTQKEEIEKDTLDVKIDSTFQTAVKQYRYLSNQVTLGEYPKTFYKDKDKIWVGTFEHGLDALDKDTGLVIKHYGLRSKGGLHSNFVYSIFKTLDKEILILRTMIEHILSLDDEVDKDMYLVTLEHLLSIKEDKVNSYIQSISTSY